MNFSIAMATYNGGDYILEQLESFESQTYKPYELIVCDDGSTDNTLKTIQEFAERASFKVRIYENEKNLGYAQNFAKAISLCEGDWIALSDHDDKWLDHKLSRIKSAIENNPDTKIIIHDYILTDSDLIEKEHTNIERLQLAGGQAEEMISGCATVLHKQVKAIVLPIPIHVKAHDSWIHSFFKYNFDARQVLKQPLMFYRRHGTNVSGSFQASDNYRGNVNKLLFYRVKNALPGYLNRIKSLEEIKNRVNKCNTINFNMALLNQDIALLNGRIAILKSAFPKRQALSIKYLIWRQYNNFNGLISFFNDFFKVSANKP